jgi:hypothetical protein
LSSRKERRPREGADDGADFVARGQLSADCGFNLAALRPSLPHQAPTERAENAGIPRRRKPEEPSALDPLENAIRRFETSLKRLKCANTGHCPRAEEWVNSNLKRTLDRKSRGFERGHGAGPRTLCDLTRSKNEDPDSVARIQCWTAPVDCSVIWTR